MRAHKMSKMSMGCWSAGGDHVVLELDLSFTGIVLICLRWPGQTPLCSEQFSVATDLYFFVSNESDDCRREGGPWVRAGEIIFPEIIFHLFACALMLKSLCQNREKSRRIKGMGLKCQDRNWTLYRFPWRCAGWTGRVRWGTSKRGKDRLSIVSQEAWEGKEDGSQVNFVEV